MTRRAALLLVLASCGGGGGAITGDGDGGIDETGDGGIPGSCRRLCGTTVAPAPNAGLASFAPPGCTAGAFERTWSEDLTGINIDAAKMVPLAADLDGDGHADLALNARKLDSARVYPGDGQGGFGAPVTLPQGTVFAGGWGVDLGDFDGDGDLDLLAGDHTGGGLAWKNGGAGPWTLSSSGLPGELRSGAGLGDVDGDGDLDAMLGADQFSSGVILALGNGAGAWTVTAAPGLGTGAVNAGVFTFDDLDGDGDLDAVGFGQQQSLGGVTAFVWRNDGASWVETARLRGDSGSNALGNPVQGGIGDLDCDGDTDVAAGGTIYLAEGDAWSAGTQLAPAQVSHLGDMDGDGDLDLVTHSDTAGLQLFLNDGEGGGWTEADAGLPDGSYIPPEMTGGTASIGSAYGIDLVDLNGDGALDVVRVVKGFVSMGFGGTDHTVIENWTRRGIE